MMDVLCRAPLSLAKTSKGRKATFIYSAGSEVFNQKSSRSLTKEGLKVSILIGYI